MKGNLNRWCKIWTSCKDSSALAILQLTRFSCKGKKNVWIDLIYKWIIIPNKLWISSGIIVDEDGKDKKKDEDKEKEKNIDQMEEVKIINRNHISIIIIIEEVKL